MCETHDLGFTCPQWHTLMSEEQVMVKMRVVCPQDVTNASEASQDGLLEKMGSQTRK